MPDFSFGKRGFFSRLRKFAEDSSSSQAISEVVSEVISAVDAKGDAAALEYTLKFDKAELKPSQLKVSEAEFKAGLKSLKPGEKRAIKEAIACVESFNRQALPKNWTGKNPQGAKVGERFYPIRRVGVYIPGGVVPLISTVVMTTVLARIAGVPEICVCTPPNAQGEIAPPMLGVLKMCGIQEVYRLGGIQAIASMGLGTKTIPAVDKLFGPGNAYTNEAKRQMFGRVGIDLLPGPSEVMVIVDDGANPAFVASDLLAQAEHGSGKEKVYLVYTKAEQLAAIETAIEHQLPTLTHEQAIRKVLKKGFAKVQVNNLEEAVEVANFIAPEHLELQLDKSVLNRLSKEITTAGAILMGYYTPTALGDFTAGPSHTLPTGRVGRFFAGLTVSDFMRRSSIVQYNEAQLKKAEPVVSVFAALEKLDAHGRSVSMRAE